MQCNQFCKFCHGQSCDNSSEVSDAIENKNSDKEEERTHVVEDEEEKRPAEEEEKEEEGEENLAVKDSSSLDEININFDKF